MKRARVDVHGSGKKGQDRFDETETSQNSGRFADQTTCSLSIIPKMFHDDLVAIVTSRIKDPNPNVEELVASELVASFRQTLSEVEASIHKSVTGVPLRGEEWLRVELRRHGSVRLHSGADALGKGRAGATTAPIRRWATIARTTTCVISTNCAMAGYSIANEDYLYKLY
jgi:hypothetical protein